MRTEINEMLLRRKNKVTLEKRNPAREATKAEQRMVVTIMKNVESLGFTFDKELFENLLTYTQKEIEEFYLDLIKKLKPLVGADKKYNPMYPNFPQQVVEMEDTELFINAIIHYWTSGTILPLYETKDRLPLIDDVSLKVLSVGNLNDIFEIFANLVSSKTSLSQQDKKDVAYIIETYSDYFKYLPDEIPLKENVALIGKLICEKAAIKDAKGIQKYYKTATDVLRLVTALSDGDISLATKTMYRKLRRCERRMIMDLLAGCGDITEDLFRYQYEWIRVAEIIHPFTYKNSKYSKVNKAFDILRNQRKPEFVPKKVQDALKGGDMKKAAKLLMNRPGEFARQLDKLIRDAEDKNYIINCFAEVADEISAPVLLQLRQHFEDRNKENDIRVFFPKGSLAKATSIKNELLPISEKICRDIVDICERVIIEQFRSKEHMGNVYIDDEMMNYIVPFSQRSASSANKNLVRGSRVSIPENASAIRAFVWWTNTDGKDNYWNRVDIDLSAAIFDENWRYLEHVSYTNLRSSGYKACHSGDITDGGNPNGKGVAEFIDIDIASVGNKGRYVCFQVYSYTHQKFSELKNCRFGWMEREDVDSGEIFEPSTVDMSIDVNSDGVVSIPVIFDCKTREFIWCDMSISLDSASYHYYGNNVESNLTGVTAVCYAMTHISKPNLHTLILLNTAARGNLVHDRNEADIIFSNDKTPPIKSVEVVDKETGEISRIIEKKPYVEIVTAYDIDYFMGKML